MAETVSGRNLSCVYVASYRAARRDRSKAADTFTSAAEVRAAAAAVRAFRRTAYTRPHNPPPPSVAANPVQEQVNPGQRTLPPHRMPLRALIKAIVASSAEHYNVSIEDIIAAHPSRVARCVLARQACIYLIRESTRLSLKQIGKRLGGRDHTTILYGHRIVSTAPLQLAAAAKIGAAAMAKLQEGADG